MKLTLLISVFALISCAPQNPNTSLNLTDSSIINGNPVSSSNPLSKSVVGIALKKGSGWSTHCTGTVLNKRFILTAAHCAQDMEAENLLINFSLQSLETSTEVLSDADKKRVRKVKSFLIHPNYSFMDNDFAVILMEDEAPSDVQGITFLPDEYLNLRENMTILEGERYKVKLIGFGITDEKTKELAHTLRETTVSGIFSDQNFITDQRQGTGACDGDSGGPAFLNLKGKTYQIGVMHGAYFGSTTCHEYGHLMNPALDKAFIEKAQKILLPDFRHGDGDSNTNPPK